MARGLVQPRDPIKPFLKPAAGEGYGSPRQ